MKIHKNRSVQQQTATKTRHGIPKRVLSILLTLIMVIGSLPVASLTAGAEGFPTHKALLMISYEGIVYDITYQDEKTKTGYVWLNGVGSASKIDSDLEIPEVIQYDGYSYTVIAIEEEAFARLTKLKSVFIPASVRFIGKNAFKNLSMDRAIFDDFDSITVLNRYSFASKQILNNNATIKSIIRIANAKTGERLSKIHNEYSIGTLYKPELYDIKESKPIFDDYEEYENDYSVWYQFETEEFFVNANLCFSTMDLTNPLGFTYLSSDYLIKDEAYCALSSFGGNSSPLFTMIDGLGHADELKIKAYEQTRYTDEGLPIFDIIGSSYSYYDVSGYEFKESKKLENEIDNTLIIMKAGETKNIKTLMQRSGFVHFCDEIEFSKLAVISANPTVSVVGTTETALVTAGDTEGITTLSVHVKAKHYCIYHGIHNPADIVDLVKINKDESAAWCDGVFNIYVVPELKYEATYNSITITDQTSGYADSSYGIGLRTTYVPNGGNITLGKLKAKTEYQVTQKIDVSYGGRIQSGTILHDVRTQDGYPMEFYIESDDPGFVSNSVNICYEDGTAIAVMSPGSYDNETHLRKYKAVIPTDEEGNLRNYRVTVDGEDAGVTLRQVKGQDSATAEFVTARIQVNQDGAPKTDAIVNLKCGKRTRTVTDNINGLYKAYFVKDDSEFTVKVSNVVDKDTNIVSARDRNLTLNYNTVTFKTTTLDEKLNVQANAKTYKTILVKEGYAVTAPPYPNLNGYSFNCWNTKEFAEGESRTQESFDFETIITGATTLYAHFIKASIEINDIVRCDKDGNVDKEGKEGSDVSSYIMPNLGIFGFGKGKVIKSALIKFTGINEVKIPAALAEEIGVTVTTKDTEGSVASSGGYYTFTSDTNVVMKFDNKISYNQAEQILQKIIITPKLGIASTLYISVAEGVQSVFDVEEFKQTQVAATPVWTLVTSASSIYSQNVTDGYYYFANNVTFNESKSNTNGLVINGTNVNFYIPAGVTVKAYGKNASGQTGGGAGIYLTGNKVLNVYGNGQLNAYGGNAASGSDGEKGGNGVCDIKDNADSKTSGKGGNGGAGGGGAGAGIGTNGGSGGSGGAGGASISGVKKDDDNWTSNGGNSGSAPNNYGVTNFGTLNRANSVTVTGAGGSGGSYGGNGGDGGADHYETGAYEHTASGGGGGGGGGAGYPGANIGCGGSGGAGGGGGHAGGLGKVDNHHDKYNYAYYTGGKGGVGSQNGDNGMQNDTTGEHNKFIDTYYGASGGSNPDGGLGGSRSFSNEWLSSFTNTITFDGSLVGGDKDTTYSYNSFEGTSIKAAEYIAPEGLHFNGWKISIYGIDVTNKNNSSALGAYGKDETYFDSDEGTIDIAQKIYGDITFKPDVEIIKSKSAVDNTVQTFKTEDPVEKYYDYNIITMLDGTKQAIGAITLQNVADSSDKFTINEKSEGEYKATLNRNCEYKILLNGADTGYTVVDGSTTTVEMKSLTVNIKLNGKTDIENEHSVYLSTDEETFVCEAEYYGFDDGERLTGKYTYYVLANSEVDEYSIMVDGLETDKTVAPSSSETIELIQAQITVTGNTKVDSVAVFSDTDNYVLWEDMSGKFVYTVTSPSDTVYDVYVNGLKSGSTIKFNEDDYKADIDLNTITVKTKLDGVLFDDYSFTPSLKDYTFANTAVGTYEVYAFEKITNYVDETTENVTMIDVNGKEYPVENYAVTCDFYSITVAEGIANGTIETGVTIATAGDEVEYFATPAEAYILVSVTNNGTKTLAEDIETKIFTMPAKAVTLSAEFRYHDHQWSYEVLPHEDEEALNRVTTIKATCAIDGCLESPTEVTLSAPINPDDETKDPVYDGTAKLATITGSVPDVTTPTIVYYDAEGTELTGTDKPVDAGDYSATITYTVSGTDPDTEEEIKVDTTAKIYFTIDKAQSIVTAAPTAKALTYNCSEQVLINAGSAQNGVMQYAIGTDSENAPTDGWSTELPKGTNAGRYFIWYKSKGNKNYYDTEPLCMIGLESDVDDKSNRNYGTFIDKKVPTDADFSFAAPDDIYYTNLPKVATVKPLDEIVGMGDVTVRYFTDSALTKEIKPSQVGTDKVNEEDEEYPIGKFYVSIDVEEGLNYKSAKIEEMLWNSSWKFEIKYRPITITFDKNSPSATGTMENEVRDAYYSQNLKKNTYTNGNLLFRGWATYPNGLPEYTDGQVARISDTCTLYAVWGKDINVENPAEEKGLETQLDEATEAMPTKVDPEKFEVAKEEEQRKGKVTGIVSGLDEEYAESLLDEAVKKATDDHYSDLNVYLDAHNRITLESVEADNSGRATIITFDVTPWLTITTEKSYDGVAEEPESTEPFPVGNEYLKGEFIVTLPCGDMVPLTVIHYSDDDNKVQDFYNKPEEINYNPTDKTITIKVTHFSKIKLYKDYIDPVTEENYQIQDENGDFVDNYDTVEEAIENIKNGQTFRLLKDYEEEDEIVVPKNYTSIEDFVFVLDTNGKTFNGKITPASGFRITSQTNDNGVITYVLSAKHVCPLCKRYEAQKDYPVYGWILSIVHYFYHLIYVTSRIT